VERHKIDEIIADPKHVAGALYGKSLSGLNLHPSIGNRFSTCCNGGFSL
jgi:hypothetical protein